MAGGQLGILLKHLRRLTGAENHAQPSDVYLLQAFVQRRDERAFATLLERHATLVWNVCLRTTSHAEDAEDAFQVTFLVLARKAGRIGRPELLANWLHGVALRSARHVQAARARRHSRERQVADMPEPYAERCDSEAWRELRPVLDDELGRLPEKYRLPMILCYLEGKTNSEAAEQLGWPCGTVSGRLARARALLRGRLLRRGVTMSLGVLGTLLAREVSAAPADLIATTLQSVVRDGTAAGVAATNLSLLVQGVLRTMFIEQMRKVAGGLVLLAVLGLGITALAYQSGLAQEAGRGTGVFKSGENQKAPVKPDISEEDRRYVSEIVDPEDMLEIPAGQMKLLVLGETPKTIMLSGRMGGGSIGMMAGGMGAPGMGGAMGPGPGGGFPGGGGRRGGGGGFGQAGGPGGMAPDRPGMAPDRPARTGSNGMVTYNLITDTALAIAGQNPGTSVLHAWFADPKDSKKEKILSLVIRVTAPATPGEPGAPKGGPPSKLAVHTPAFKEFVKETISPQKSMELMAGRPRVLMLNQTPKQILVSNEQIVGHSLLGGEGGKQLYLEARALGSAVLCLFFTDLEDAKKDKILCYLIKTVPNPEDGGAGSGAPGGGAGSGYPGGPGSGPGGNGSP